jgi:pimeloyl-ACP methyl ester carboxylesterase
MITTPVVILINGLFMYQPGSVSPLAPLANRLEAAGWEVCIDTHLLTRCPGIKPDLIVGHSQGGASALGLAARYPDSTVVTFDAVRMPPCRAKRCVNFRTAGYPNVAHAENIPVFAMHTTMVYHGNLQAKVLAMADEISAAPKATVTARKYSRAERRYTRRTKRKAPAPEMVAALHPPEPKPAWQPPNPHNEFPILIRTVKVSQMFECDFSCRWEEAELLYTMDEPEWSMETICAMMIHPEPAICPR